MAAAGEALCAARVAGTNAWRSEGDRSPARFIARQTGTSVGQALEVIDTGKALPDLFTPDDAGSGGGPRFCQRGSGVNAIAVWTKKLRPVVGNGLHTSHQEGGREQAAEKRSPE